MYNKQGKYNWFDGKEYTGMWESNEMNGFGKYIWPDGKIYEG